MILGNDIRPYFKCKRYLFNSYEDPHSGKWTLKRMRGRNAADQVAESKGAAPGTVAEVQGKANTLATGKAEKGTNATAKGKVLTYYSCGQQRHMSREC
jgi:hypothetical protein